MAGEPTGGSRKDHKGMVGLDYKEQFEGGETIAPNIVRGLILDINNWFNLGAEERMQLKEENKISFASIIKNYEALVKTTYGESSDTTKSILEKSSPETVKKFNAIINEIRERADEIIQLTDEVEAVVVEEEDVVVEDTRTNEEKVRDGFAPLQNPKKVTKVNVREIDKYIAKLEGLLKVA